MPKFRPLLLTATIFFPLLLSGNDPRVWINLATDPDYAPQIARLAQWLPKNDAPNLGAPRGGRGQGGGARGRGERQGR